MAAKRKLAPLLEQRLFCLPESSKAEDIFNQQVDFGPAHHWCNDMLHVPSHLADLNPKARIKPFPT